MDNPTPDKFQAIAVFDRPTLERLQADLDTYLALPGDVYLRLKQHGHDYALQVCDENENGGGDLNDSHVCPGSPGCG